MNIENIAKSKVMAKLGDYPNEVVVKTTPFNVDFGFDEEWFLIFTESRGHTKVGRILVGMDKNSTSDFGGGIFWVEENNIKKIQSIYLEPEFRKGLVMPNLMNVAKKIGINTILKPFSKSGESFSNRYKLNKEE